MSVKSPITLGVWIWVAILVIVMVTQSCHASDLSCVTQGLTAYPSCGIPSVSCSGASTGYFRSELDTDVHGNKRWLLCAPDNHIFSFMSFYNLVDNTSNIGTPPGSPPYSGYGSSNPLFVEHETNRAVQIGMTALDIYGLTYAYPVANQSGSINAVQLPFNVFWSAANDGIGNVIGGVNCGGNGRPFWFGYTDCGLKNLCFFQNAHGYTGPCTSPGGSLQIDPYDPRWTTINQAEVSIILGPSGAPPLPSPPIFNGSTIKTTAGVISYTLGDPDWFFMIRGFDNSTYPLAGQVVATSGFDATVAPFNQTWQERYVYAKLAWACGGTNPAACNGTSFLETKYGTIAALKASWGACANGYTTFGSAGGFGVGTGVLDEDGNGACFSGKSYYTQATMSANLVTDLKAFTRQFTRQIYKPMHDAITVTYGDTNHTLFSCGNVGGVADVGIRPEVAMGMVDAGCTWIIMAWNSANQSLAQTANQSAYDATCTAGRCTPQTIWYQTTAQQPAGGAAAQGNYSTQTQRGAAYVSDRAYIYANSIGTNGDRYNFGINFWEIIDSGGFTDGFITKLDNLDDGGENTVAGSGADPWNYKTGGQAGNYGNLTGGMTSANAAIVTNYVNDFSVASPGGLIRGAMRGVMR